MLYLTVPSVVWTAKMLLWVSCCSLMGDTPLQKGKDAMAMRKYREAISHFSEAITAGTKDAETYYLRGSAYLGSAQIKSAIPDFDEALRLNPKFPGAHRQRGLCYYMLDQRDKAIADLNQAIQLDPKDDRAYVSRGHVHEDDGEYGKSLDDCKKAIELKPDNVGGYIVLARVLAACPEAKLRDGKKALEYAKKLQKLDPDTSSTYFAHSIVYAELGDFEEAIKWEEKYKESVKLVDSLQKESDERLKLYGEKKPFREKKKSQ
jgi:tetratricopeptide (TPR) repeat protein